MPCGDLQTMLHQAGEDQGAGFGSEGLELLQPELGRAVMAEAEQALE